MGVSYEHFEVKILKFAIRSQFSTISKFVHSKLIAILAIVLIILFKLVQEKKIFAMTILT